MIVINHEYVISWIRNSLTKPFEAASGYAKISIIPHLLVRQYMIRQLFLAKTEAFGDALAFPSTRLSGFKCRRGTVALLGRRAHSSAPPTSKAVVAFETGPLDTGTNKRLKKVVARVPDIRAMFSSPPLLQFGRKKILSYPFESCSHVNTFPDNHQDELRSKGRQRFAQPSTRK